MNKKSTTFKMLMLCGFLAFTSLSAQNYENLISDYLYSTSSKLKTASNASKEFTISNIDRSESMKADVLQVQQTYNSIPVYQGISTFLIKDNQVEYANENFVSNFDASKTSKKSKSSIDEEKVAQSLFPKLLANANIKSSSTYTITKTNSIESNVDKKIIYFPKDNQLILAMEFNFEEVNTSNYWHVLVDIETGEILLKENLTVFCQFDKGTFSHEDHTHSVTTLLENKAKQEETNNIADARYNVFPFPIEAPTFGNRAMVSEDRTISPDGWHYDGTTSYTTTRGNNVYTYEDINGTNTASYVTDAGNPLVFDYPLDINSTLDTYRDAAITNLFYANNRIHDVFYKFGFTETARNFQQNNYGFEGRGNDAVFAEARDGYGRNDSEYLNNANFSSPADGSRPRMQMYVWNPISPPQRISFNAPSDLVGLNMQTQTASFGPYSTATPVVGDLVKSEPANGCTTFTNDLTNKIAFVERGTCNFTIKVKNAQVAGAKAVIVYNVDTTQAYGGMGGTDATVTIPSALITYQDGQRLSSALNSGTNVNLTYQDDKSKYIWIDASLDNGIIIHEYGHGISNRLTGTGSGCLNTNLSNEQMGEGWSDFFALMLTNRPGDNASVARGMGTFANAEQPNGGGIRPAKYSPDFAINNYTYGRTNGMTTTNAAGATVPHVHSIGFVWATMLWDLHWKYVDRYGYSSNVLSNPNSGSAKVLQLVMDGLKLQSCNPTFINGRDAILKADEVKGGTDRCMIWETFAKRGLGVKASAGGKTGVGTGINDQVEDFTVPADCSLSTQEVKLNSDINVYPNPAKNEVTISSKTIKDKVNIQIFDVTGRKVLDETKVIFSGANLDTSKLTNGVYILKLDSKEGSSSQKLIIKK